MKTDATRLAAFVDGELGLDEQLALEARLREDPALQSEVEALRALREGMKRADYHAAPAALRRFAGGLAPQARPQSRGAWWSRWPGWRSRLALPSLAGAAGVAVALLLSFSVLRLQTGGEDDLLLQEAVAGHVRASLSQHRVDVVSSERHTVKPWLSARLDFSPPVPDLHREGLVFDGARVDYLDGRAVAVLVYRQGQHQVDVYVWPSGSAQGTKLALATLKGFHVARWTQGGMAHCMVSDLNEQEFGALVAAWRQAEEAL